MTSGLWLYVVYGMVRFAFFEIVLNEILLLAIYDKFVGLSNIFWKEVTQGIQLV